MKYNPLKAFFLQNLFHMYSNNLIQFKKYYLQSQTFQLQNNR